MVLTLLGAVGVGGFFVYQSRTSTSGLPEYDAPRPQPARIETSFAVREPGRDTAAQLEADARSGIWHVDFVQGTTLAKGVSDGDWFWMYESSIPGWVLLSEEEAAPLAALDTLVTRVPVFDDFVPSEATEFFEVVQREALTVAGRDIDRIELEIAARAFQVAQPVVFSTWSGTALYDDAPPISQRVVVDVDENGVVWRVVSTDEASGTETEFTLVAFDDSEVQLAVPINYYDRETATPDDSGPSPCEVQLKTLQTAIEVYFLENGVDPTSEDQLVPDILRSGMEGYDLVDGVIVPVAGVCPDR